MKLYQQIKEGIKNGFYLIKDGLASISLYNYSKRINVLSDKEAMEEDRRNLQKDWEMVGKDMRKAMDNFQEEQGLL